MKRDIVKQPSWPRKEGWSTRREALHATLLDSDPGDSVVVHQTGCNRTLDKCSCAPEVLIVPDGLEV